MSDKIEQFWREATAEDVAKVMRGEQLQARFRDKCVPYWTEHYLCGVNGRHWIAGNFRWDLCQVYDPPGWFTNKPDSGEGYRLLEKFPDEGIEENDQFFDRDIWLPARLHLQQIHGTWYRRRIEPVRQDAGSTSASNIPTGWTALSDDEPRLESDAYWSQDAEAWVIIGDGWVEAANREKWPAIRQVETHKTMMLLEGCFYRLPNGQGIKVTKKGFDVF